MEPNKITINSLILILLIVLAAEALALAGVKMTALPNLAVLGIVRVLQIAGILWIVGHARMGLAGIGWAPPTWSKGLIHGAVWSLGFAIAAAAAMAIIFMSGHNPIQWLRFPLPRDPMDLVLFFLVGGLVAPVAEEICFRGVIYTFMRDLGQRIGLRLLPGQPVRSRSSEIGSAKMGASKMVTVVSVAFAIFVSTFIFTILHAYHSIPVTQIIGGIVFAIAYETSQNLMVPIVIHILGNLAIFSLSLL